MLGHASILVAEDDTNDILLMRRAFEIARIPNPIQVVTNGREAVAYLEGSGQYSNRELYPFPGLLLLDLKMPWMDGFDVLRWMRSQEHLSSLPVVILTSSNLESDIKKSKLFGVFDYRVKPNRFEDLVKLITDVRQQWLRENGGPIEAADEGQRLRSK